MKFLAGVIALLIVWRLVSALRLFFKAKAEELEQQGEAGENIREDLGRLIDPPARQVEAEAETAPRQQAPAKRDGGKKEPKGPNGGRNGESQ